MNQPEIKTDIAIVGGGIAGLWTLNLLVAQGFDVVLLEKDFLGGGQTVCSQGIIHGGMKYALTGKLTKDAQELSGVPDLWRKCLTEPPTPKTEQNIINLAATKILADAQYLFSTGSLATNISSFFASKTLHSAVESLTRDKYPLVLQDAAFKGQAYKLAELVLDVPSLLHNLAGPCWQQIIKVDACSAHYASDNYVDHLQLAVNAEHYQLAARQYIFLAGGGNQALIAGSKGYGDGVARTYSTQSNAQKPKMQLRPLHMVYVKSAELTPLYAHCIGLSATPRLTVTTHLAKDGEMAWYLGGNLAEEGVGRDTERQIKYAQQELLALFPWLNLGAAKWGSLRIDRAEANQDDGKKPTAATVFTYGNVNVGWPTKLAFSPLLAQQISNNLAAAGIVPRPTDLAKAKVDLAKFAKPEIAPYPWDT